MTPERERDALCKTALTQLAWLHTKVVYLHRDSHPSQYWARHRVTSLMWPMTLPLSQTANADWWCL